MKDARNRREYRQKNKQIQKRLAGLDRPNGHDADPRCLCQHALTSNIHGANPRQLCQHAFYTSTANDASMDLSG